MIIKNKNKKNIKKVVILLALATLLVTLISGIILEKLHIINLFNSTTSQQTTPEPLNSTKIDTNPATNEQINNGNTTKTSPKSDTPQQPTVTDGNTKKAVSLTISSVNQNGSTLQIRVLVGADENTGTCTLTLSSAGRSTVTETAGTQALASTSTCKGFDVPTSELSIGTWHALISYESPDLTGTVSQDVVIK